ncbi:YeeE/YedE thiosulfate transporter family protein [Fundidesulfovibrio terrae]|uniref:YeeE/YedE thiosulfate transporter family protein n=1 Tax=Fundidesulfovibrio terrae TaxID=2922866 RepID=UPI001FB02BC6|nr:YeeE/YedE thiosulfate transporter family protein [Fundidesulfovibrio terrae]
MSDHIISDAPQEAPGEENSAPEGGRDASAQASAASGSPSSARPAVPQGPGKPPMNPYLAGMFLGLTLLASYLILGAGLGASGGFARFGAWLEHQVLPAHVEAAAYFGPWFPAPLSYYLVFMVAGVFAGGFLSAISGGRLSFMIERGPTASSSRRLLLALIGGCLAGFASRLAQGCTSGQGLSGGAMLLTGSFVFMGCLFATGYLTAWAFRRQWK